MARNIYFLYNLVISKYLRGMQFLLSTQPRYQRVFKRHVIFTFRSGCLQYVKTASSTTKTP